MRRFPVKDFEKYLIFYLPHKQGIDVIRILHGAQDIDSLISEKET
jgi:toxin ParE1/3/4